ncbi:MAG: PQQ-binding-like beta-propeller repeat protein [Sedimentisphaerales bacterium]|nr:PQQ-binding-like beta-propeller repeat protein [Sedimentisphaerales bacterium]
MKYLALIIPVTLVGVAFILVIWWYQPSDLDLQQRIPGTDRPVQTEAVITGYPIEVQGIFEKYDGVPADLTGSWPRFRGSLFDNIYTDPAVNLTHQWPAEGPPVLWEIDVGEGHAGAVILDGKVYVLDYDRPNGRDSLRCLSLADGRDIWRYSYPVKIKRNHGMSRTVPAVTDKYIVILGPKCHVTCLDSQTGRFLWAFDLVRQYGTKEPLWYAGQCPIIENDRAIIAPAGKDVLMTAIDCATGKIVWETPNTNAWKMTHSSIIPMDFNSRRMYIYCGGDKVNGGVVGVWADDGTILWQTTEWKISTTVPSPLVVGPDRIFFSGGYNAGSMMVQLIEKAGQIEVKTLYHLEPEIFGAAQHTPIFYQSHIYGIRPDEQFVCLDPDGNVLWTSGSDHKFGIGPFIIANGLIYAMDDHGLLRMIQASPTGYNQLAEAQVLPGPDSWGPMTIAHGRLILRDLNKMICLDITK